MKKNLLKNSTVQTLVASLLCIVLGLFLGYLVLLLINPDGRGRRDPDGHQELLDV